MIVLLYDYNTIRLRNYGQTKVSSDGNHHIYARTIEPIVVHAWRLNFFRRASFAASFCLRGSLRLTRTRAAEEGAVHWDLRAPTTPLTLGSDNSRSNLLHRFSSLGFRYGGHVRTPW
jgi:hypothetical protein